jgi:hypothetical protein
LTRASRGRADDFVVCIHREKDDADLIIGKVYRVRRAARNDRTSDVRIIDESGEDYLYPRTWFVPVALPLKARKVLAAAL